jgi:hypothetical protein
MTSKAQAKHSAAIQSAAQTLAKVRGATRVSSRARLLAAAGPYVLLAAACSSVTGKSVNEDAGADMAECPCAHGTCDAANMCVCEPGWAGPECSTCAEGYEGPNCIKPTCDEASETCGCDGGVCDTAAQDDGELVVNQPELNLGLVNNGDRRCDDGGDAVAYRVVAAEAKKLSLDIAPARGCLGAGDEVLLISVQGAVGGLDTVGNYELLRVSEVRGRDVYLQAEKQLYYGDAANSDHGLGAASSQHVFLQRVPNYQSVNVATGATLVGAPWDGSLGGVLAFRAAGRVSVSGSISMAGRGFRGKETLNSPNNSGVQGEGLAGPGVALPTSNSGGGGGGPGDDTSAARCGNKYGVGGGGGGHATAGTAGTNPCAGEGGATYGSESGKKLLMGAAGGSGGADDYVTDNPPPGLGGSGGGIIIVLANALTVTGTITANGQVGVGDTSSTACLDICQMHQCATLDMCYDFSGPGGGGAGGSIYLQADTLDLGNASVTARGGLGGKGDAVGNMESIGGAGDGGNGGAGRVFLQAATSVHGESDPPGIRVR